MTMLYFVVIFIVGALSLFFIPFFLIDVSKKCGIRNFLKIHFNLKPKITDYTIKTNGIFFRLTYYNVTHMEDITFDDLKEAKTKKDYIYI